MGAELLRDESGTGEECVIGKDGEEAICASVFWRSGDRKAGGRELMKEFVRDTKYAWREASRPVWNIS